MPILITTVVCVLCVVLYFAFDRKRYQGAKRAHPQFRPTGEIFIDPGSGKKMQVFENPSTGERKYMPLD